MRNHLLVVSVSLAIILGADAAKATTYTAASCNAADFMTQIALAKDGDVVQGPSGGGSATWSTAVTGVLGITLAGNGCVITFSSPGSLFMTADTVNNTFVTGFTFQQGFPNGGCPITFSITSSTQPFRFYGNTLSDNGSGAQVTMFCIDGLGQGVIDHNSWTFAHGADEVIHINGVSSPTWSDNLTPGSANMLFIETNTFTNTGTAISDPEEAYNGAEFAFRYNTMYVMGNDIHDGGNGGRWSEVYNNTYNLDSSCIYSYTGQFRGGSGVNFGNSYAASTGCSNPVPGFSYGPDCPSSDNCSGTYPVQFQVGTGYGGTNLSPAYVWGNTGSLWSSCCPVGNGAYHSPSDSQPLVTVGIGLTDATNCTAHPGNVCNVVSLSSAPSTIEVCQTAAQVTAGCPASIAYTPYQYPHPLTFPKAPGTVSGQAY